MIQSRFNSRRESAHMAAIGCLHLILADCLDHVERPAQLTMAEPQIQRTVKQMINYMTSQYAHPVSIEQMCASLGYNRAYLSRIFKKETGMTPVAYLLKLRIDQSKRLLRERRAVRGAGIRFGRLNRSALFFKTVQALLRSISHQLPPKNSRPLIVARQINKASRRVMSCPQGCLVHSL